MCPRTSRSVAYTCNTSYNIAVFIAIATNNYNHNHGIISMHYNYYQHTFCLSQFSASGLVKALGNVAGVANH